MNDNYYDIDNSLFQRILKESEPSETTSQPSEKEYGCVVCKHCESCEPNPFGICNEFERKEEKKND